MERDGQTSWEERPSARVGKKSLPDGEERFMNSASGGEKNETRGEDHTLQNGGEGARIASALNQGESLQAEIGRRARSRLR